MLLSPLTYFYIFSLFSIFCSWIYSKYAWNFYKYSLEERYFKIEKGIIWKTYNSIPYKKIQNIDISRGIFDRLLGLSNVNIQTAGQKSPLAPIYEGRLPGLSVQTAQDLQKELLEKVDTSS